MPEAQHVPFLLSSNGSRASAVRAAQHKTAPPGNEAWRSPQNSVSSSPRHSQSCRADLCLRGPYPAADPKAAAFGLQIPPPGPSRRHVRRFAAGCSGHDQLPVITTGDSRTAGPCCFAQRVTMRMRRCCRRRLRDDEPIIRVRRGPSSVISACRYTVVMYPYRTR